MYSPAANLYLDIARSSRRAYLLVQGTGNKLEIEGYILHSMNQTESTTLSLVRQCRGQWSYKRPRGRVAYLSREQQRPGEHLLGRMGVSLACCPSVLKTRRPFALAAGTISGSQRVISIPGGFRALDYLSPVFSQIRWRTRPPGRMHQVRLAVV